MYRLMVKYGKGWKMGRNAYNTFMDALKRKAQMEAVGHKVVIVESEF